MAVDDSKSESKDERGNPQLTPEGNGEPLVKMRTGPISKAREQPETATEMWVETFQTIGIALIIALVVRSFLFQPFNIPSESMKPTLLVGDFLFVSKFSYGYSQHSLPFSLPIIPGRQLFTKPTRGDVAVFKTPADNRTDYIKRIIGLPGDEIEMIGGVLHINSKAVQRKRLKEYVSTDPRTNRQTKGVLYEETLPNGVSFTTLDLRYSAPDDAGPFYVPAGHYFMMGDNRDNSNDSRVPISMGGVGYVPVENFVGRAEVLFFSFNTPRPAWQFWRWPGSVRFGRVFSSID